ncbi:MAG TPA: rhodanese-like domain-containing protein [Thermoanaerobaculia bacterium]|jgi:glyoxylase-like metal-dependent hydrolase (beta-lactamase superfamily II)/rhodanese-related sulfurtransferase
MTHFRQFYLSCLAHASYLIASGGEAVVVDPQRDVAQYLEEAERIGARIRYVIETHLHADFVSGHGELAPRSGAEIVFGAAARAEFPHRAVHDGDELRIGEVVLRAIETPGHTPESVCWLMVEDGAATKVLTGDTLFIGDVGRPDLAGGRGYTPEQMAAMLYDSLLKLLRLDDAVEVWPAHGAGSACGKNISSERSSTIGAQRRMNWALRPMERDEFVKMLTTDLPRAPRYFPMDAEINRRGARPLDELSAPALTAQQVHERMLRGAMVLDVRDSNAFGAGHLPGAINIGLRGQYASWAGTLLPPNAELIVVAESAADAAEAVMRLARVGLENVSGVLDGGADAWTAAGFALTTLPQLDVSQLKDALDDVRVLDVRRPGEYASGHVPRATNIALDDLPEQLDAVDASQPLAVICAGGYRSSAAASLLQRRGAERVFNVVGGTSAWVTAGYETE